MDNDQSELMDKATAEYHTTSIKTHAAAINNHVAAIHDKKGYLAMGYKSFSAWCEAEMGKSRQHLYYLMEVEETRQELSENPTTAQVIPPDIPDSHVAALAPYSPEIQLVAYPAVVHRAESEGRKLNADMITAACENAQTWQQTGYVPTIDGSMSAMDASVGNEQAEVEQARIDRKIEESGWERLDTVRGKLETILKFIWSLGGTATSLEYKATFYRRKVVIDTETGEIRHA